MPETITFDYTYERRATKRNRTFVLSSYDVRATVEVKNAGSIYADWKIASIEVEGSFWNSATRKHETEWFPPPPELLIAMRSDAEERAAAEIETALDEERLGPALAAATRADAWVDARKEGV